jgi:hypothetical protein
MNLTMISINKENGMNVTQRKALMGLTAVVLSASLLNVAAAQQGSFPQTREQAKSCAEVDWNKEMTTNHPRLIDACREVVHTADRNWARFEAKFARVEPDGTVSFSIRDSRDRHIEDVVLQPAVGQVAYIDNRATAFTDLRRDQLVNLYVPEGQYGFVTQPGAPADQVAVVAKPGAARAPATAATSRTTTATTPTRVAAVEPRAARLPATAGLLPWFALGGFLSLLGAVGLRLGRRH